MKKCLVVGRMFFENPESADAFFDLSPGFFEAKTKQIDPRLSDGTKIVLCSEPKTLSIKVNLREKTLKDLKNLAPAAVPTATLNWSVNQVCLLAIDFINNAHREKLNH